MRIIYLHQYFNTPHMAGGTRSYEMARRLVAAGHEVHIITSWREPTNKKGWFTTKEAGIKVHWLPVQYSNNMSYRQRIQAFFRFAIFAARKAASIKGDVVFASSTPLTIAIPAVYAAKRQKIPMVFEVRDLWPYIPIAIGALKNPILCSAAKWLERWAYRHSEAIVALSPGMREGIVRVGYPSERVIVIPNSSDNDNFLVPADHAQLFRNEHNWLGDRPLLVYLGTFGRINDVGYFVDIAIHLKSLSPEVRILLVGDGLEFPDIVQKAEKAGVLGHNLFIKDKVPKKDVPVIMATADMACSLVLDLPELQANSANKFFDALAAGKPVLINYGGWQADLIEYTGCGIVTWGLSHEEAAKKISQHINDRKWLNNAGKAAKLLAVNLFDRDVLAGQLEQTLRLAISNKGDQVRKESKGEYDALLCKYFPKNG